MRPYLIFTALVLLAAAAFAQQPHPGYGPCFEGCGPFIPLVSTPMVSLQTVSPNPVGASNATIGLSAGATNGTLSQIQGSTSSVYTAPVWYQGGAPLTTSQVHLWPETLRHGAHQEWGRDEHGAAPEESGWTYYTGREHTADPVRGSREAKGFKKADHVYTNDDVARQNDKNGNVKYDGKTEKM
jgi:hypothetical protein